MCLLVNGLSLSQDASTAYIANYLGRKSLAVQEIDRATGKGTVRTILEHLVSPTSIELVQTGESWKLYVVCCGELEIGWIHEDDKRSWSDFANINAAVGVSVTVTTEEIA